MPAKTFNDRLTPEDKEEIKRWDKFLRNDNKAFTNANRRDRYHNLGSLDENISIDGRATDLYELIAAPSSNGEEVLLTNELIEVVIKFLDDLKPEDKLIMIGKLTDKPMPSTKLANLLGMSDKTVTTHFKKYQKMLQQQLKNYI